MIEVYTQSDLDKALESHPDELIICLGSGKFILSGSAQVRAYDSAQVTASGSAQVRASKYVAVTKDESVTEGAWMRGVVIELPAITSAEEWCEFYGVEVVDGVATLFK